MPSPITDGLALLERIHQKFWDAKHSRYVEKLADDQPAFNWAVGVMLSAMNSAAALEPKWKDRLRDYLPAVMTYWNELPPVAGFDVLPAPKPIDRYYDDNAWMAMALLESYDLLKDPNLLVRARLTVRYVLSAEDDKLGGGLYWRESDRASKNTCINAPAASACLALYAYDKNPELLAKAEELYAWTYAKLRDPADGVMWDAVNLKGEIGKDKWSYNTALMIRAAVELFRATGKPEYKAQAEAFCKAAVQHWLAPKPGVLTCEGKFGHLLVEALQRAQKAGIPTPGLDLPKLFAGVQSLAKDGLFGHRWDRPAGDGPRELIDQAAVARALLFRP